MAALSAAAVAATDWRGIAIAAFIGVVATLIAGWLFLRLQEKRAAPRLAYLRGSRAVVGSPRSPQPSDIELRYRGEVVPRVTQTRIALWNAGRRAIQKGDVPEGEPITIAVSSGEKILEATVVRESRAVINFIPTVEDARVVCSFEFLDHDDGVVLDVIHTDAENREPFVTGTVIGMGAGPPLYLGALSEQQLSRARWLKNHIGWIIIVTIGVALSMGGVIAHDFFLIGDGGLLVAFGGSWLAKETLRPTVKRPPKSLLATADVARSRGRA
jgi:hypothetical protein